MPGKRKSLQNPAIRQRLSKGALKQIRLQVQKCQRIVSISSRSIKRKPTLYLLLYGLGILPRSFYGVLTNYSWNSVMNLTFRCIEHFVDNYSFDVNFNISAGHDLISIGKWYFSPKKVIFCSQ